MWRMEEDGGGLWRMMEDIRMVEDVEDDEECEGLWRMSGWWKMMVHDGG